MFVFSATIGKKVYWTKNANELPVINGLEIEYHIYPIYEIGSKITNLLRERIFLKNGQFTSHYFHFQKYMDENKNINSHSLFICGTGEFTTVFLDDAAYIHYSIITKSCYRVNF
jgi:hypothetical protein